MKTRVSFPPSHPLARVLRSIAGNVAIMTAFAVIPMLAMIGGAVDASRTYMAYTRLQQACDAGALAGRKAMSNATQLSDSERAKANEFFAFNFPSGTYAAQQINAVYSKGADGVVVGKASLSMPTTLMRIFGHGSVPVRVSCQAELKIPNTDVMFVLDITGSMLRKPDNTWTWTESERRIYGLKQAVKDFYATLGPGAASGAGRIRYGFMPYNSNVNVGRILYTLNPALLVGGQTSENWTYPSRQGTPGPVKCGNDATCNGIQWTQYKRTIDVKPYVTARTSITNPAYWQGDPTGWNSDAPASFAWSGCIEEASTVPTITKDTPLTPPAGADDLNIDLVPTSGNSRWKPQLLELMYSTLSVTWMPADPCPAEAQQLTQYTADYNTTTKQSPSLNRYLDTLIPGGGTYHDIGLIWGARFLSPSGIFSATNSDSAAPGGYQVSRHIVFMTDGLLETNPQTPDAWGLNESDGRAASVTATKDQLNETHRRRTQIICNEMKKRGFIIWVVGFGTSGLSSELKQCATDKDHRSFASDTAALRAFFSKMAQTIGGLRLS